MGYTLPITFTLKTTLSPEEIQQRLLHTEYPDRPGFFSSNINNYKISQLDKKSVLLERKRRMLERRNFPSKFAGSWQHRPPHTILTLAVHIGTFELVSSLAVLLFITLLFPLAYFADEQNILNAGLMWIGLMLFFGFFITIGFTFNYYVEKNRLRKILQEILDAQ